MLENPNDLWAPFVEKTEERRNGRLESLCGMAMSEIEHLQK